MKDQTLQEHNKTGRERLEEIKGRSFRVCQRHFDERRMRGIIYTDEIVPKSMCALCKPTNKTKMKDQTRKCMCMCHDFQKPPYYSDRCDFECKHCKDQTLEEHNKEWRDKFEEEFIDKGTKEILLIRKKDIWQFIETQNKALLKKECQRITKIIDSIEEFDEPSCLADEALLLSIKREIKSKVNI